MSFREAAAAVPSFFSPAQFRLSVTAKSRREEERTSRSEEDEQDVGCQIKLDLAARTEIVTLLQFTIMTDVVCPVHSLKIRHGGRRCNPESCGGKRTSGLNFPSERRRRSHLLMKWGRCSTATTYVRGGVFKTNTQAAALGLRCGKFC